MSDDSLWLSTMAAVPEAQQQRRRRRGRRSVAVARPFRVDFNDIDRRQGSGNLSRRRQPLARALGAKTRTVFDATAGWGRDAALAALMGFDVLAAERCAVVSAMLTDGLVRAEANPSLSLALGGRLSFKHGDACEILAAADGDGTPPPDAILIDPMWSSANGFGKARRKVATALPRASLQLLSTLLLAPSSSTPAVQTLESRGGANGDGGEASSANDATRTLIDAALRSEGVHRVVLKKPRAAPPLEPPPNARQLDVVETNLVRFDVLVPL